MKFYLIKTREQFMINMERLDLNHRDQQEAQISIISIWEDSLKVFQDSLLVVIHLQEQMIYLNNSLEVEILLLTSLMTMMISFLQEELVILEQHFINNKNNLKNHHIHKIRDNLETHLNKWDSEVLVEALEVSQDLETLVEDLECRALMTTKKMTLEVALVKEDSLLCNFLRQIWVVVLEDLNLLL